MPWDPEGETRLKVTRLEILVVIRSNSDRDDTGDGVVAESDNIPADEAVEASKDIEGGNATDGRCIFEQTSRVPIEVCLGDLVLGIVFDTAEYGLSTLQTL